MMSNAEKCRRYKQRLRHRAYACYIVNVCFFCGAGGDLEFAHVKPTKLSGQGRGMDRRFRDVLSHPDCYVIACKSCHYLLDHN